MKRLSMAQAQDPARRARLAAEITAFQDHLNGVDLTEGLRAFAQKRAPDWSRDKTR